MRAGRIIKILHTLGSLGLMGGVAACLVLRHSAPAYGGEGYQLVREQLNALFSVLIVPSMGVTIFSGFASMIIYKPYWNALWAWAKAGSGVIVLQYAFRMKWNALELSAPLDPTDPLDVPRALANEYSGFWVLLIVSALNVVVGVWRPRIDLTKKSKS
jgi:hypothetical protein